MHIDDLGGQRVLLLPPTSAAPGTAREAADSSNTAAAPRALGGAGAKSNEAESGASEDRIATARILAARVRLPRLDDLLLIGGLPDRSSLAAGGAVDGRAQGIESAGRRDYETVEGADEHERVSAVAPSAAPLPGSRC